jgi:hypothetical protein
VIEVVTGTYRESVMLTVPRNPAGTIANFDKCEGAAIRLLHVEFQGIRPQLRGKVVAE